MKCSLDPSNCTQLLYSVNLIMFPLWLAVIIILLLVWILIEKSDKHLLLLWLCNYYSLNTIISWLVNRKIIEFYALKLPFNRKTYNHFFLSPDAYQNYLGIFFNKQMPKYCFFILFYFFGQSSKHVSNEQQCSETTGLYEDLLLLSSLFHFFYFIFNAPFHLLYVF